METIDYHKAISLYYGQPGIPSSRGGSDALFLEFGVHIGGEIARKVDAIFEDVGRIGDSIDWTKHTLDSATRYVESEITKLHPEVSKVAMRLIGNFFAYWWK